jgi:hypothetical protein
LATRRLSSSFHPLAPTIDDASTSSLAEGEGNPSDPNLATTATAFGASKEYPVSFIPGGTFITEVSLKLNPATE